jgi:outer membrane cobalamin receptor
MRNLPVIPILFLLLNSYALNSYALNSDAEEDYAKNSITDYSYIDNSVHLDTVSVEAHKSQLMNADYQVFQREDFINRYQNLSSFLQQQNGLQVQQAGGLGNPALVSIRGASSSQTTLLINGIKANNSQFGGYDLNTIPLNQIEAIEISRSGSSFDLADQAIGGTINIITRQSEERPSLSMNAGSEKTIATSFSSPLTPGLSVQVDHEQSANDYEFPVPSPINNPQNRNRQQSLENAEFNRSSIQLVQNYKEIAARIRYNKQKKNIPDYFRNSDKNKAFLSQEDLTLSLQGEHQFSHKNNSDQFLTEHSWQLFHQTTDENFQDKQGIIGLGTDNDKFIQSRSEAQWQSKILLEQWQFQTQISAFEEHFASKYLDDADSNSCTTPQGSCDQMADQQGTKILFGARWSNKKQNQQVSGDLYKTQTSSQNQLRNKQDPSKKDSQSFIGYNLKYSVLTTNTDTHFSIKKSNRHPSLFQLFGDRGLLLGNPSLEDERSINYSIDNLYRVNKQHQINSAIFYRELENAIIPVYDSRGIGRYENSKQANLSGIELQWKYQNDYFYNQISADIYNSTTTDKKVKSFDDKQIAGIYHKSLSVITGLTIHRHNLELINRFSGEIYIDRSNIIAGDDSHIIDVNYQYQYDQLSLGASLKNLADIKYNDFTNRPATRRQWMVFTRYNF